MNKETFLNWDSKLPLYQKKEIPTDRLINVGKKQYYGRSLENQPLEKLQRGFALTGIILGTLFVIPAFIFAATGLYGRAVQWIIELDTGVIIYGKAAQKTQDVAIKTINPVTKPVKEEDVLPLHLGKKKEFQDVPIKTINPVTKPVKEEDVLPLHLGKKKGFHGIDNSCHLCSLLFSYFGVGGHFNHLLNIKDGNPLREQIKAIIDSYQKNGYVPPESVQNLRVALLPNKNPEARLELVEVLPALIRALEKGNKDLSLETDTYIFSPENLEGEQDIQRIVAQIERDVTPDYGDHVMIHMPSSAEVRRPLNQVIPNQYITLLGKEGPIKMQLVSLICMGDYDPAYTRAFSQGHFVTYSFDKEGNGYYFDSMAGQEGLHQEHLPEIHQVKGLMDRLQKREKEVPDYLEGIDRKTLSRKNIAPDDLDPRRIQYNLKACLYMKQSN